MNDRSSEPAPGINGGATTAETIERLMGARYLEDRALDQSAEIRRLRSVAQGLAALIDRAAAVVGEEGFRAASMSFAHHAAALLSCARASVGVLRTNSVTLAGISGAERLDRTTALHSLIVEAMHEAVDQGAVVVLPSVSSSRPVISRQHEALAREAHPCVLTLPVRVRDEVVGALTLERDDPFGTNEIGAAQIMCDLVAPRLDLLRRTDRWFGARLGAWTRRAVGAVVGERYTWTKLGALAGCAFLLFAFLVEGTHRVPAPCTITTRERAVTAAPFDGRVREVFADLGDRVESGALLMRLEDSELRLTLASAEADLARIEGEVARAQTQGDGGAETDARLRAEQARAEIAFIEGRLERARVVAPSGGTVVAGDWDQRLGAPVARGETLFEIADLERLRVDIRVEERDVRRLEVGQRGTLATAAYPSRRVPFVIDELVPFANADPDRPVFLARAALEERPDWLRAGMEGEARIELGRRSYAWLWSYRAVEWVRLKLWL